MKSHYRGRLAPSPTGLLHLGHARTFWIAARRAAEAGGTLVLRNEDLDPDRSNPQFTVAMLEDLRWLGIHWQEGPDCGGPFGPYCQSQRHESHRAAFEQLRAAGFLFPCQCSRQDVRRAVRAPQAADDEPIYPGTCRGLDPSSPPEGRVNWRFSVPDGEAIQFHDHQLGPQQFTAGRDFGDFIVWRHDGVPSYQLAVVADDAAMGITEVVRGADLLVSTARQLLLYRALQLKAPEFFHCDLVTDAEGRRLAKRDAGMSLRALRERGLSPEKIREDWQSI